MPNRQVVSSHIESPIVTVPGSKYLANRYIALAALASGITRLSNLPQNDDIEAALEAVKQLGATVTSVDNGVVDIEGIKNYELPQTATLNCRDSGTLSRFITAVASNLSSQVVVDASEQMRQRPMQEVSQSLRDLGVAVSSDALPISLTGPIPGGRVELDTSRSSQYLSGLLIACLKEKSDTYLILKGKTVSSSYIQLTKNAIELFGGKIEEVSETELKIPANQSLTPANIHIASDVVSSSYFMAAGLLAETTVTLTAFDFESPQGESQFYRVLEAMGASIKAESDKLVVGYTGQLRGIDVDMGDMPDVVPTLVVLALFAKGETYIHNIAHLAFKESNRIVDLCDELNKLGVDIEYDADSIRIKGDQPLRPAHLSSCHDHRLAMSYALVGIKQPGIVVTDAQAVEKSFPKYWEFLENIGLHTELVN